MAEDLSLADLPQPAEERTVSPDRLSVDGENPNSMTEEMFGKLVENMRSNGWTSGPILITPENVIIDGEHRWRAAQEVGLSEVPVAEWDLTEEERRLWRLEQNKIRGTHDRKRDALEYDYLLANGMTDEVQSLTNATGEDLDELLAEIRVEQDRPLFYDYPSDHNVHFMDCIEGMREHLDDESVDLIFTSPPYNVEKSQGGTRSSEVVEYDDDRSVSDFRQFLGEVFAECARVLKPSGHMFVNIQVDNREGRIRPPTWVNDLVPLEWRSFIVWDKKRTVPHGSMGANRRGRYYLNWEPILHFTGEEPRELNGTRNYGVWHHDVVRGHELDETDVHPAPFPKDLVEHAIESATDPGDLVLDPFMGSGTSAVAAIFTERDYVGFELDEAGAYRPIVERRISEARREMDASESLAETAGDD